MQGLHCSIVHSETINKWYTMVTTLLQLFVFPEDNNCFISFHFMSHEFKCIYKLLLACIELYKCVLCTYFHIHRWWVGYLSLETYFFKLFHSGFVSFRGSFIWNCQNFSGQDAKWQTTQFYIQMYVWTTLL